MTVDERRQKLSEYLALHGFAGLAEMVEEVGVSESTVRRDLSLLEEEGVAKRTHGGAVYVSDRFSVMDYERRKTTAEEQKQAIGRETARLVKDGETVLLDGGTTTFQVARHLSNRSIQVVTNSLPIATLLNRWANIKMILVGGYIYPETGEALGPITTQTLETLNVDKAIMGAAGITEDGLYNANVLMVEANRKMIDSANEVIIVADGSKFGKTAIAKMCEWSEISCVVSDTGLETQWQDVVGNSGAKLILAQVQQIKEAGS